MFAGIAEIQLQVDLDKRMVGVVIDTAPEAHGSL